MPIWRPPQPSSLPHTGITVRNPALAPKRKKKPTPRTAGIGAGLRNRSVVPTKTKTATVPFKLATPRAPATRTTAGSPQQHYTPTPAPPSVDPGPGVASAPSESDPYGPLVAQALAQLGGGGGGDPFKAATRLVNQLIGAQTKAAQLAYSQRVSQAQADAQRVSGIYQGAAQAQQALHSPEAVQGAYGSAATSSAAFGKGFSDAMQASLNQTAGHANADLASIGAPQGQQIGPGQAEAAGNVLYGLGGNLPAQTFNQQGASAYRALAGIPSATIGTGAFYAAGGLSQAQKAAKDWLASQQASIAAGRPAALAQFAGLYDTITSRKQAAAANRASLLLGAQQAGLNLDYKKQSAALAQSKFDYQIASNDVRTRNTLAKLYGSDPITGQLTLDARKAIATQRKAQSLNPTQRQKLSRSAGSIADGAFNGVPATTKTTAAGKTIPVSAALPKLTYQAAIREMLNEGIPLGIAQAQLNRFWNRSAPGVRVSGGFILMPWEKAGQGRPLVPYQLRVTKKRKA